MKLKAAIYHSTNSNEKRPKIYENQINELKDYAVSMGFEVTDVFCDKSLKRTERTEFNRFLSCCNQYDVLITKDFYHIAKNTGQFFYDLIMLSNKGLQIYSIENGIFTLEDVPIDKPLRVATYTCHYGTPDEIKEVIPVRNDIFTLFSKKKTSWTVVDQYFDESLRQNDGEQIHMMELIKNRDKYDLLLVHNLNDVHWRTAKFCKLREQLRLDIYSLQEGFLKYRRTL